MIANYLAAYYRRLEVELHEATVFGFNLAVSDLRVEEGGRGGPKIVCDFLALKPGELPPPGKRWCVYHTAGEL